MSEVVQVAEGRPLEGTLVLARRPGECVRIIVPPSTEPQTIFVGIRASNNSQAKISFLAPRKIEILRTELTEVTRQPVAEASTDVTAV